MNEKDYSNLINLFNGYGQGHGGLETIKALHHSPTFNFNYLLSQNFPEGPFYRTISLDKLPKVGDVFESDYSGWWLDRMTAHGFGPGPVRLVVYTNRIENLLISFKSLGPMIIDDINESDPLYSKVLDKIYSFQDEGRDELIMTPFKSQIKSLEIYHNYHYARV